MIKVGLGWIVGGVVGLGLAFWGFKKATTKQTSKLPAGMADGPLTFVPENPTTDECDVAYSSLPEDAQEAWDDVIMTGVKTNNYAPAAALLDDFLADDDLDEIAVRTVAKCFWKKMAKDTGLPAGYLPDPSGAPTAPAPTAPLAGSPGGPIFPSDGEETLPTLPVPSPIGAPTSFGQLGSLGKFLTKPTPVSLPGYVVPAGGPKIDWPAVNALPSGGPKEEALDAVSGVSYAALFSGDVSPCLNNGGYCSSLIIQAVITKLQAADFGFGSGPMKTAAMLELSNAASMLTGRGL